MSKKLLLSFANLTCRFGDRFVLLDLAREIIYPAFFDEEYERRYGPTRYIFRDVGIANIEVDGAPGPQLTIYGRLIKDTIVSRSQVFSDETGLVPDVAYMPSAPSAFFALDLDNHKLAYLPETAGAPSINQFALTLEHFASERHHDFLRELKEESRRAGNTKKLGELQIDYPFPNVEATPLSGDTSVDSFIGRFQKITRATFQLRTTNAEFSRAEDFKRIREMKDSVLSETTTLAHSNSAGLRKEAIAEEVKVAAAGGNQRIKLRGVAEDGTELSGSNEDLKLQIAIQPPPENRFERATEMIKYYFAQVKAGLLRPDEGRPNEAKLADLKGGLDGTER